jgi:hypothetical protein
MLVPSLLLWGFTAPHGLSEQLPDHDFGLGLAVACVIALACWVGGQWVGGRMVQKRRARLKEFLFDPVRG